MRVKDRARRLPAYVTELAFEETRSCFTNKWRRERFVLKLDLGMIDLIKEI